MGDGCVVAGAELDVEAVAHAVVHALHAVGTAVDLIVFVFGVVVDVGWC